MSEQSLQLNDSDSERISLADGTAQLPPVPTREQLAARRRFRRDVKRAQNPLYIPIRWFLLVLAIVLIAIFGTIILIFGLRGEAASPALSSSIEIVTAEAKQDRESIDVGESVPSTNAAPTDTRIILAAETPAILELTGPAVPTVIITSTPIPLAIGVQAAVYNVGNDELNVRNIPSLKESDVLFRAAEGTLFNVIGGPQQADGFSWWQLHDPQFEVIGWAVANYLQAVPD